MFIEVRDLESGEVTRSLPKTSDGAYWVMMIDPSKEDLVQLGENMDIPYEDLEDALDEDERPRLEIETDIALYKVVFRVPTDLEQEDRETTTKPVVIILYKNHIIQIFSEPITYKKFRPTTKRPTRSQNPLSIFLDFLAILVKSYELSVDILDNKIREAEEEIFQTIRSESILNVFELSKDAIYLGASLRGNVKVYRQLARLKIFREDEGALEDLDDLSIDLEQQNELMGIYRQLIEGSLDAYASVISNNQNELLKVLTSISFVLMIPTLIASLYGMNVPNFLEQNPLAFVLILIVSAIFIIPLFAFLKYKDWI
ncbi:MAG: magnesium transporter CorA family protein [Candidatus Hermodarchaeota archaeon]